MGRMRLAAVGTAALIMWAGVASAEVMSFTPQGPDNHIDAQLSINRGGDFSVKVVFDKAAFATLTAGYGFDYELYVGGPCGFDGPGYCYNETNSSMAVIDPYAAGATPPMFDTPYSQVNWAPTNDGLTLNFYAPKSCLPVVPDGTVCHEMDRLKYLFFNGTTLTDQPVQFEVTFGDAAPRAVPEPATWAMMILGFGLVGGTLRRRHTAIGETI